MDLPEGTTQLLEEQITLRISPELWPVVATQIDEGNELFKPLTLADSEGLVAAALLFQATELAKHLNIIPPNLEKDLPGLGILTHWRQGRQDDGWRLLDALLERLRIANTDVSSPADYATGFVLIPEPVTATNGLARGLRPKGVAVTRTKKLLYAYTKAFPRPQ